MAQQINAVIFDCDGTLVDSERITLGVLADMIIELGADVLHNDADSFAGTDLKVVLAEVERRFGRPLVPSKNLILRFYDATDVEAVLELACEASTTATARREDQWRSRR